MKFEYDKKEDECRTPVAELYKFNGGPELCLAMKAQDGKTIWLYHNSLPSIQSWGFDDNPVKRFYPGDKITITF